MRLIWWLTTVTTVSLTSIVLSHHRALDPVQNLSLTVTAPVQERFHDIASPVNDLLEGVIDRGSIVRENERLRDENERLQAQLAQSQDAAQRVLELEDALGVKQSRPEDQLLGANVIAQDTSGFKRAIAIDRGHSDGIDEGMVVLSRNGTLVGTVSRAYDGFAWVRLITDSDTAVNAQISGGAPQPQATPPPTLTETPAPGSTPAAAPDNPPPAGDSEASSLRGVVEGDLRQGLVLDLLPPDAAIAQGSLVTTSGLGGNFPRGILIGSIESIDERPQAPFLRAVLEPAARLSDLDTILVLVSFKPARLSGP